MEPLIPHQNLNAFVGDKVVVFQPSSSTGSSVESLSVDLQSGSVQQLSSAPQKITGIPVRAVLGVVRLFKGRRYGWGTSHVRMGVYAWPPLHGMIAHHHAIIA